MKRFGKYIFLSILLACTLCACEKDEPTVSEPQNQSKQGAYLLIQTGKLLENTKALQQRGKVYIANVAMALYDSNTGAVVAQKGYTGTNTTLSNSEYNPLYADYWASGEYYNSTSVPVLSLMIPQAAMEQYTSFRLAVIVNMRSSNYGDGIFTNAKGFYSGNTRYSNFSQLASHSISTYAINQAFKNEPTVDMSPTATVTIDGLTLTNGVNFLGYTDNDLQNLTLSELNSSLGLTAEADKLLPGTTINNLNVNLPNNDGHFYAQPVFSRVQLDNVTYDDRHFYITDVFMMNVKYNSYFFKNDGMYNEPASGNTSYRNVSFDTWVGDWETWAQTEQTDYVCFPGSLIAGGQSVDGLKKINDVAPYKAYSTNGNDVKKLQVAIPNNDFAGYVAGLCATVYGTSPSSPVISADYPYSPPVCQIDGSMPIVSNQKNAYFKLPFFYVFPNDGSDETSTDASGRRNYYYATRLVVRGLWKDNDDAWSTSESGRKAQGTPVYYPIIVNGEQSGVSTDFGTTSQSEIGTLIKRNRLYRLRVNITGKGVRNPWASSALENRVKVTMTVDENWSNGGEQYIKLK